MSLSRKSLRGPKTRTLRFETMEDRLYLSATPFSGPDAGEEKPPMEIRTYPPSQTPRAPDYEKVDQLMREGKAVGYLESVTESGEIVRAPYFTAEYAEAMGTPTLFASESTAQADVSVALLETASPELLENTFGPQDNNWMNQKAPTILVKKVQDGLVSRDGKVIQNIIFEFERIIDPNDPDAINQSFTTWYDYYDRHGDNATPHSLYKQADGSYATANWHIYFAVMTYHEVTFRPGETKVQWVCKVNHDQYLGDRELILGTVNQHEIYGRSQLPPGDNLLRAKVNLAEQQQLPVVNVAKIQDAVVDPVGSASTPIIFEFERTGNTDESLTLNLNYGFSDKNGWVENHSPYPSFGYGNFKDILPRSCQVTFQPGETKVRLTFDMTAEDLDAEKLIHLIIADSLPDDAGAVQEYIVGKNRYVNAGVKPVKTDTVQQSPVVSIKKVQDALHAPNYGGVVQPMIFEFERSVDPDGPSSLDRPLTILCSYTVENLVERVFKSETTGKYTTELLREKSEYTFSPFTITFQPGETKAYWSDFGHADMKVYHVKIEESSEYKDFYHGSGSGQLDKYTCSAESSASARVVTQQTFVARPPEVNITKIYKTGYPSISDPDRRFVIELERTIDPNHPEELDKPLVVKYVCFSNSPKKHPFDSGLEIRQVVFSPGQTTAVVWYNLNEDYDYIDGVEIEFVLADSFPELYENNLPLYTIGPARTATATVNLQAVQQTPHVNVKTLQEGKVSPNGQIQQSIIFEFERTIDPNRPDDLNEPLTIEYEFDFYQGVPTEYRDQIAHLLDNPLSITFEPGKTTARLEFSGFGYNEYKVATLLRIRLLGTEGEHPQVKSENFYAESVVSLVDNPGEQSIPKISVRVVPEQTHGEKVVFEIERMVDPNNPRSLDESLEIRYDVCSGQYMYLLGYRSKARTWELRSPGKLVFEPGQSKITLEYTGHSDQWIEFSVFSPVGRTGDPFNLFDENGQPITPQVNTMSDYIVEQGRVEADFGLPCPKAAMTPTVNVTVIQEGVIDADGKVVQNPILEFERVFDPGDSAGLNEPLDVTFWFQGYYSKLYGSITFTANQQVLEDCTVRFQPGETKVRFEYDTNALLAAELGDLHDLTCLLGVPEVDFADGESQHYHFGNHAAEFTIQKDKTSDKLDEDVVEDTTITQAAPTYTVSGPTEGELAEMKTGWWEMSAETSSNRPIMNWEINWGDGSEETRFLGGPRNRILTSHKFRDPGTYTVTAKTTDLEGRETTTIIGTYVVKARDPESPSADLFDNSQLAPPAEEPSEIVAEIANPALASSGLLETPSLNFVASGANRIAEIDMYFHTEATSSRSDLDFGWISSDPASRTEETRIASEAVFSNGWNPLDPMYDWNQALLGDVL